MKSGFVSLIGRPNVGKSTILNAIIGEKISIVTPKSQTTRNAIEGIYNDEDSQIIFIDTPGIHKPFNMLGTAMDKISYSSIRNSDLSVFLIDASRRPDDWDMYLLDHLKFDCPLIIAFNKIDLTNINLISELKELYQSKFPEARIVEVCAIREFGIDDLIKVIKEILPEGPRYYDVDVVTTEDLRFRIQEIIRETMLNLLKEEVPHSALILCEEIKTKSSKVDIFAKIIIEKESQKGIVVGKKGSMIKKIGTTSRMEIEKMLSKHVNLELTVQLVENWRNSKRYLVRAGYNIK